MCEIDPILLQKFNETKKELLKDPKFKKERQASYTTKWRHAKKEAIRANPEFIANRERIVAEREKRRAKVAAKMEEAKEKRDERKAIKKEIADSEAARLAEYNDLISCIENHPFRDKVKKIKFNKRENNGIVNSIAVIILYTNPDKKTKTMKEVAQKSDTISFNDMLKFKLISILATIENMYKTKEKECEEDVEPTAEDLEDFSDFDFGD